MVLTATVAATVATATPAAQARGDRPAAERPAAPTAPTTSLASTASPAPALDTELDAVVASGMPGILARTSGGTPSTPSWQGASGLADIDTGRAMRPGLRFRIGSITKPFVATVLLQYVGEGRLRLDEPVATYLPDALPDELGRAVTVRMLLNQTSGLPDYDTVLYHANDTIERYRLAFFTPRALVRHALTEKPGTPGAAWGYSNTNYILAGMLVERLSGRRVEAEVTRRLIRPLGLRATSFPTVSPVILGPHPRSYVPVGTPERPLVDFSVYTPTVWGAAGAMVSTTEDLQRFFGALVSGRVLGKEQLTQMQTTVPTGMGYEYGLGLMRFDRCETFWGHDGVAWGQSSFQLTSPSSGRQVTFSATMSNYGAPGNPIDQALGAFLSKAACPTGTDATGSQEFRWPHPGPLHGPRPAAAR